jgi:hypothetical protein
MLKQRLRSRSRSRSGSQMSQSQRSRSQYRESRLQRLRSRSQISPQRSQHTSRSPQRSQHTSRSPQRSQHTSRSPQQLDPSNFKHLTCENIRQILLIEEVPTPLPRRKDDLISLITNLANKIGVMDVNEFIASFDETIHRRKEEIKNTKCLYNEVNTIFGNSNSCPIDFIESTSNCCRQIRRDIFYINTENVMENCLNCPVTNKQEKMYIIKQASKEERELNKDFSEIVPDRQETIKKLLVNSQKKAFSLMTDQFNELFSLANVGECEDDVSDELLKRIRSDKTFLGKAWDTLKSSATWFVKFTANSMGYILTILFKVFKAITGSYLFGKALTMAQTFAAYFVYSPQSTRIMLFILKKQLKNVCASVGNFLMNLRISDTSYLKQSNNNTSYLDFLFAMPVLDTSRMMKTVLDSEKMTLQLGKATGYAGKLIGGTLKGVPFIGGFLGAASEVLIDIVKDSSVEAISFQLQVSTFETDVKEAVKLLFEIIDFNTCLDAFPRLVEKFPMLNDENAKDENKNL